MPDLEEALSSRNALREAFRHFKESEKLSQEALDEFSKRKTMPVIDAGEYEDYAFAISHDRKMARFVPQLLEILSTIRYISDMEFSMKEQAKLVKENDAIVKRVRQLIEDHEIAYSMLDNIDAVGAGLLAIVKRSTGQISNRAGRTYHHLAEKEFGTNKLHCGLFGKYLDAVDDVNCCEAGDGERHLEGCEHYVAVEEKTEQAE